MHVVVTSLLVRLLHHWLEFKSRMFDPYDDFANGQLMATLTDETAATLHSVQDANVMCQFSYQHCDFATAINLVLFSG